MAECYIDLIFSTPKKKNPLSALVKKIMKTDYSHVAIKIYSGIANKDLIFEASVRGVVALDYEHWKDSNQIIESVPLCLTREQLERLLVYCVENLGKKYGYLVLFSHLFVYLFRSDDLLHSDGDRTLICSELAYLALKHAFGEEGDVRSDRVSPRMLREMVQKLGRNAKSMLSTTKNLYLEDFPFLF